MKAITTAKWILLIYFLCISMQVFPQTEQDYYNRLYYLCKVWGFAKYYHTEIAKGPGTINWDDQLLFAVPLVKASTSDAEFNAAVLQMLNSAGPMRTSTTPLPPNVPDELNLIQAKDLTWMDDPIFSGELKSKLHEISDKFRPQSNYYVGTGPTYDMDNQYNSEMNLLPEEKRLLGLFRYWNIYNYFYPYKRLMDQDWDVSLAEIIPKMVSQDGRYYASNISTLRNRVNDSHAMVYLTVQDPGIVGYYAPFQLRYIEGETVITKVLPEAANLAVGDVIKVMDGKDIYDRRSSLKPILGGSTDVGIELNVNNIILSGAEGPSSVIVSSDGITQHEESFIRETSHYNELRSDDSPAWKVTLIDGCTFGIVNMGKLQVADVNAMFTDLWNTEAIIFDIRNYPNGTLWTIVNYLFSGPLHLADFTFPDITFPGHLRWVPVSIGTGTPNPYNGKVIILFDERTGSQAEYTCMGLENFPDAIKIGSQTWGTDGDVKKFYLPGNLTVSMTGDGVYYPDHTLTQRIGIIPDYEVHPTIAGIRAGKDEVMEAALDCALLSVHPDYCNSAGNATKEWIASVSLGANSKTSGSSGTLGYEKFLTPGYRVESGKSCSILLRPGFITSKFENWAVWIDFNGDGGFDEPGELVFSKTRSKTTVTGTVVIPAGLSLTTRMRVTMSSAVVPGPCSLLTAGEVEDYALIIGTPAPVPPVAAFTANPATVTVGAPVQFTDQSINQPISWEWIFTGGDPATSSAQNPKVTYSTAGIYDVTLKATNNAGTGIETKTGYITVNNPVQYCVPASINSSQNYIKTVAITGAFTNSTAGTGFTLYTDPLPDNVFTPGTTYPLTLTPNNSVSRNYWRIWIDFNMDGDFDDAGELVFTGNNKRGALSGSISIPGNASGATRMRISMQGGAAPGPCNDGFAGEVEDYNIILGSPGLKQAGIIQTLYNNLKVYPNPVSQKLNIQLNEISGPAELFIYSMEGKLLRKERINSNLTIIDVSKWANGVYLVRMTCEGFSARQKFIKD